MTDAADREAGFLAVLKAAEEYLQCQHELARVLRAGFFAMARARYQMGPSKVGPSQYPATMRATRRVHGSETSAEDSAVSRTADDDDQSGASNGGVSADLPASAAMAGEFSSSLLADLASRYASNGLSEARIPPERANKKKAQQHKSAAPLQWFGIMVSPDLRKAADDFSSAVEAVEKLAAAQQRLCQLLDGVQSCQPSP